MSSYISAFSESFKCDSSVFPKQAAIGISLGIGSFLISTAIKKTCHVFAGIKFEEYNAEPVIVPPHRRFDEQFIKSVFVDAAKVELIYRAILQPQLKILLTDKISWFSGRV